MSKNEKEKEWAELEDWVGVPEEQREQKGDDDGEKAAEEEEEDKGPPPPPRLAKSLTQLTSIAESAIPNMRPKRDIFAQFEAARKLCDSVRASHRVDALRSCSALVLCARSLRSFSALVLNGRSLTDS